MRTRSFTVAAALVATSALAVNHSNWKPYIQKGDPSAMNNYPTDKLSSGELAALTDLSEIIHSNPVYRHYTLAERTDGGKYMIGCPSFPVVGDMPCSIPAGGGHRIVRVLHGRTDINESLVMAREPLYTEVARSSWNATYDLVKVRKYMRVIRAVYCGNAFPTIALIEFEVPVPCATPTAMAAPVIDHEIGLVIDHEQQCLETETPYQPYVPPPAVTIYTPYGGTIIPQAGSSQYSPLFTYAIWQVGGSSMFCVQQPTGGSIYCNPITGVNQLPISLPAPQYPGVLNGPNKFPFYNTPASSFPVGTIGTGPGQYHIGSQPPPSGH